MHRTISVDYGVVLKGEIELVLDDGVKTLMKEGDVVVQRGTIHVGRHRILSLFIPVGSFLLFLIYCNYRCRCFCDVPSTFERD